MNKKFIPSLIILFKGLTITALGVLFHFLKIKESKIVFIIGVSLLLVSVIVYFIMNGVSNKKKDESIF